MSIKNYNSVYITIKLSSETNKLLSEAAHRSHRKKLQEAKLRLEDHLVSYSSIAEKGKAISNVIED